MRIEALAALALGPYQAAMGFVPVVMRRLGATPELIAAYMAASYVGFFLAPFSARVMPVRGAHRTLAWYLAASRAVFALAGQAVTAPAMLLAGLVYTFLDTFPSPAYTRVMQLIYPARARARIMAFVRMGMAAAMLVITPLAGRLLDEAGPGWLFGLSGGLGVLSALLFTRLRVPDGGAAGLPHRPLRELWPVLRDDRRYRVFLLTVTAFGLGGLIAIAFYPTVIVDRLHLSYAEVGLLSTAQVVAWLIGYLVWGQLMDRKSGIWSLRALYLMMGIIPLCYLLAGDGWMLLPAFVIQGLGSAGIDLAFLAATIELARDDRTYEYAALQRSVIGLRGLFGPFIGVWLAGMGIPAHVIFILAASMYVAAAVLMMSRVFRPGAAAAPAAAPSSVPSPALSKE